MVVGFGFSSLYFLLLYCVLSMVGEVGGTLSTLLVFQIFKSKILRVYRLEKNEPCHFTRDNIKKREEKLKPTTMLAVFAVVATVVAIDAIVVVCCCCLLLLFLLLYRLETFQPRNIQQEQGTAATGDGQQHL